MAPDHTFDIFRDPCTPILWFLFPIGLMRLITICNFCHFIFPSQLVVLLQVSFGLLCFHLPSGAHVSAIFVLLLLTCLMYTRGCRGSVLTGILMNARVHILYGLHHLPSLNSPTAFEWRASCLGECWNGYWRCACGKDIDFHSYLLKKKLPVTLSFLRNESTNSIWSTLYLHFGLWLPLAHC
jgi:hypothetical protein